MGKKNQLKKRELEKQQSISSKKKPKTSKPNRKELQNLKEFGTADGDLLEEFDKEPDFEGRTWTFDSKGEIIDADGEPVEVGKKKSSDSLLLLNISTDLNTVQLGKTRTTEPLKKPSQNSFSKLLSNLNVSKKKNYLTSLKTKENTSKLYETTSVALEEAKNSQEHPLLDSLEENYSEADSSLEDEILSEEETIETEFNGKDYFQHHFGNQSYGVERLGSMIKAVEQRQWKTQPLYQSTLDNEMQIFLTSLQLSDEASEEVEDSIKASSPKFTKLKLTSLNIKPRFLEPWKQLLSKKTFSTRGTDFSSVQIPFFYHLNQYRDLYYPLLDFKSGIDLRECYVLHALNHLYKTRDRVLKNNVKLTKNSEEDKLTDELRDSGFTRPRVLILVPFRSSALKLVDLFYRLSGCEQQENRKRFKTDFSLPDGAEDPILKSRTPEEHKQIFSGNSDDCFKVGIKFTRKAMKLYTPFYDSDVILASPLGLRLIVGDPEDKKQPQEKSTSNKSSKRKDHDFLSSIEVMILDQADHLLMQNWDHTLHVDKHTNLIPSNPHGCDFSRVKNWYLEGHAKFLRQTIVLSSIATPELNSFMRTSNVAGQVHFRIGCAPSIGQVRLPTRHTFYRVSCINHSEADEKRFQYFIDNILPNIRRKTSAGVQTLLFIASYFDFTRIRNYLTEHEYSFGQASEYTDVPTLTRDRNMFASKRLNLLLYTERCHFYRRFRIKGADQIVFYGVPEYGHFYSELINTCNTPNPDGLEPLLQITSLFTLYDALKLERVLGAARSQKACHGALSTLVFS